MNKEIEIPEGYEAALERCKQWVAGTSGLNPGASPKEVAEYLFPELAESEDERIRKWLIDYFGKVNDEIVKEDRQKIIAFLERQKEQRPVQDREEREYVRTLKSLIVDFLRGKDEVDREYYQKIYDWLDGRHIEQQLSTPEDIAAAYQMGLAEGRKEQKPALDDYLKATPAERRKMSMTGILEKEPKQEWSEEDEEAHTRVLGAVAKAFMGLLPTKPSEEDVHWLKTLPERFNLQPKQEWSEEEDYRIRWIISLLTTMREKGIDDRFGDSVSDDIPDMIAWLKSLRPQPHWKPNEEQIDDLQMLLDDLNNLGNKNNVKMIKVFHWSENYKNLKGLLDNLKKL